MSITSRFDFDARIPMRDGVELSADVYLPEGRAPRPAILLRTPYDNSNPAIVETATFFADNDYAFVAADVRGRGDSDGRFRPFRGEGPDGADTIDWIAAQPWCDGRVGMMGGSYAASVQWLAAREKPAALATFVSTATSGRQVMEPQRHGKLRLSLFMWLHAIGGRTMQFGKSASDGGPRIDWGAVLSHRPLREVDRALGRRNTAWPEWMAHRDDDTYWETESQFVGVDAIDIPVLQITGWYDGSITGELEMYELLGANPAARQNQYLVIGPWDHSGTRVPTRRLGLRHFGAQSMLDINDLHLRWFDHWLKGHESWTGDEPRVRTYTMGAETWVDRESWPVRTRELALHLRTGGMLDTSGPGVDERADRYTYDPEDPTPSAPQAGEVAWGSGVLDHHDHGFVESRSDVLVYTTEPFADDITVTGAPVLELYAASSAPDTDFAAVLSEVTADGTSIIVAEGLVRTSYRHAGRRRDLVAPGETEMYRIELNATSLRVPAGHRLRLTISSALFPAYDRNPNTGAAPGDDEEMCVADQTIRHDSAHPSRLLLPVEPAE